MAKQTYAQLQKQIAMLNQQAERLRKDEIGEVVAKIKEAIKAYDISSADLYGGSAKATGAQPQSTPKSAVKSKSKSADKSAKFADGQGGEWVGRGPRPKWLRDALAAGRRLEEFATGGGASKFAADMSPTGAPAKKKSQTKFKRAGAKKSSTAKKVVFSDGAGKEWSGRGPRPGWLKAAISSGRSIDEFKV